LAITDIPARYYEFLLQFHKVPIVSNPAGNYKIRLAAAKIGVLALTMLLRIGMILPVGVSKRPATRPKREEKIRKGAAKSV
jgi:hypothetical protein